LYIIVLVLKFKDKSIEILHNKYPEYQIQEKTRFKIAAERD